MAAAKEYNRLEIQKTLFGNHDDFPDRVFLIRFMCFKGTKFMRYKRLRHL